MLSNKLTMFKKLTLFIILSISIIDISAQVELQSYFDIGETNVSKGIYIKNIYRGSYAFDAYKIESGFQFDLKSSSPNVLSAFDIFASRSIAIKKIPFDIKGFFLLNRFSDILYETNWGLRMSTKHVNHFFFELGTSFKTYSINSNALEAYDIDKNNKSIHENFNLNYNITGYLKPHDYDWNIGLSITNVDYFLINQSTNPMIKLISDYKLNSKFSIFLESWYKQAGVFNISANHFGYFFRTGVLWKL